MIDQANLETLKENLLNEKERYRKAEKKLEEIKEEEKRLRKELERVRNHIEYYDALISDMKKKMKGRRNLDILDRL